ncbi:MAG TPA: biopolymer transporter ExbD [Paludibacteraceae bacterium]|jgi:biopolymer transport protein ExbD|nr:biopolymer transporter ExbD [Paludibacteraceae bacterium]HPS09907.1 biopolymer transporter ExbD [Paludibacteraceae bacterium]
MSAEIQQKDSGGKKKAGHMKKLSTRIDFTPMVDMIMLLLTFFMLATSMSKPQTMEIGMPTKDKVEDKDKNEAKASEAVTIYLSKDHKVYYFMGIPELDKPDFLKQTDFSPEGLRKILIQKNAAIVAKVNELKDKKLKLQVTQADYEKQLSTLKSSPGTPVVVIKPLDNSTYNDMISALDEMLICNVGKYAITELDANDKTLLKNSKVQYEEAPKN